MMKPGSNGDDIGDVEKRRGGDKEDVIFEKEEEEEWGTWIEEDEEDERRRFKDLFSSKTFSDVKEMFEYCRNTYHVDIEDLSKNRLKLDIYGAIMLINYARASTSAAAADAGASTEEGTSSSSSSPKVIASNFLKQIEHDSLCFRKDDTYLKPVMEDDAVLRAVGLFACGEGESDWSEDEDEEREAGGGASKSRTDFASPSSSSPCGVALTTDTTGVIFSAAGGNTEIASLKAQLREARALLKRLTTGETKLEKGVEDTGYFGGYSHYSIHEEMLKDLPRTEGYRDALEAYGSQLKDKIVLDVGCGTGILSLFAARAGARHVIGVDRSDIIDEAREIVRQNGYEDRVTLIKSKLEDVVLPSKIAPDGTVDVIVSEWMGYMLLFESMLPSVLVARDRWLAKDGTMFPSRATMSVCAIEDEDLWKEKFGYWTDVYGFDMRNLRSHVLAEPYVEVISGKTVVSNHCVISDLDLLKVKNVELDFASDFSLTTTKAATVHGILIWFDVRWPAKDAKPLTTSPHATPTHWKQTLLFLERPVELEKGATMTGTCTLKRGSDNEREYTASLTVTYAAGAGSGDDASSKKMHITTPVRTYHMAC